MANLTELGLIEPFVQKVRSGTPTLEFVWECICCFPKAKSWTASGTESASGRVRRIPEGVHVPHMGWNQLQMDQPTRCWKASTPEASFTLCIRTTPNRQAGADVASVNHGINFAAIVHQNNIWATQFHPEKSQKVGERLLDNFARL
jgi:glutamine amidotransferase